METTQDGLRPASIQVQLYKDGLATDQVVELSAANDWKGAFENLDAKGTGKAITYTVKEVAVPDGYKVTVNDKDKANVVLTNTHEPALTEMKVTKRLDGDHLGRSIFPLFAYFYFGLFWFVRVGHDYLT